MQARLVGVDRDFVVPVAAAAVLMAVLLGTRSSMGLFVGPMNSATAMGAATISLAFALSQLAWGGAQPLAGLLAERFGTARVVTAGGVLAALALMLVSVATNAAALTAALLVAGAAGAAAGGAPLLMGAVAQRLPAAQRGLAMGWISAGSSAGQLVLAPLAAALIALLGWQAALLVLALLGLAVLPAARAFRGGVPAARSASEVAPSARHALRDRSYWLITAGFLSCGLHVSFLTSHMPSVLQLCGFSTGFSGLWLAVVGACNIAGSVLSGWLMQRVPMKAQLACLYALRALGVGLFLLLPPSSEVLLGFAVWMGMTYMATVPPTTGLIAKLYGARNVALLFGITMGLHQVGSFLGVALGGMELELTGGYRWMWLADMGLASMVALLHLPIREGAVAQTAPGAPLAGATAAR